MTTSTLDIRLQILGRNVQDFKSSCQLVLDRVTSGRYTLSSTVSAVSDGESLKSQFDKVLKNITDVTPEFVAEGGALKDGVEAQFLVLSDWDNDIRTAFARATESLKTVNVVQENTLLPGNEFILPVYVYYDGPGDLFIRGQNAQVQLPISSCATASRLVDLRKIEDLSWDRGLPLTQLSDCLWQARLVVKDGQVPKYKFLVSDCKWSTGPDYNPLGVKSACHVPTFDENHSSLLVPIDVGFGNKLVMRGQGTVQIQGKEYELSWDKNVDLFCLHPNLWVLPVSAKKDVEFKLCFVKTSGDVVWETGDNRHLTLGRENVINPNFDPEIRKIDHSPEERITIADNIMDMQKKIEERKKSEGAQRKAFLSTRPKPCGEKDGDTFKPDEIIQFNDPTRIEFVKIDGIDVPLQFTDNGKAITIQLAKDGCTAGASAMLIVDNGKLPKLQDLQTRGPSSYITVADDLKKAGLDPLKIPVKSFNRNLERLRQQILHDGPAYVRIKEDGHNGHAIILDEISEDFKRVRLRDPWHACEMIVHCDAFKQAWLRSLDQCEATDYIVQVRDGKK